jgi:hypothetical protein
MFIKDTVLSYITLDSTISFALPECKLNHKEEFRSIGSRVLTSNFR